MDRLLGLTELRAVRIAIFIWSVYAIVIAGIVAVQPDRRTVTPEYREASVEWWSGRAIYEERMHGYLYLPHCAILYTPYAMLPERLGEPLWRLTGLGLFAWSLWRLCGIFGGDRRRLLFLVATVAALPASFSSARNGQANLPMAALLAMAAVDLGLKAWNKTTFSLLLTLALKPLGVVPCLLAGACHFKPMGWRLLAGIVLLGAASFIHKNPSFVADQYSLFINTMMVAGKPNQPRFCDFNGMLLFFDLKLPALWVTGIRVLAAAATLGVAWLAIRRYDSARGAFVCLMLSAWYLLLFNPRTETNSYVLLAPFVGILVASAIRNPQHVGRLVALVAYAAILSCENWGPLHKLTNLWLKAAASLVFGGFLFADVLRGRDPLGLVAGNPKN